MAKNLILVGERNSFKKGVVMSIFYIKNTQMSQEKAVIIGEDVKHIHDALRYQVNDELAICNEDGVKYLTKITAISKEQIELQIIKQCEDTSESEFHITLLQGMPKADKLEWIIQKGTELGVSEIIPVITERVIVKLEEKNIDKKLERWNKIALEAAKQSGRQKIPEVKKPINLKKLVENILKYDILLLPYECEKERTWKAVLHNRGHKDKNIAILIGPEGGFSEEEVSVLRSMKNVEVVTLGPRILRTETAGMATIAMVLYELEM